MEFTLPTSHKELLQEIVRQLVLARDPEATFVEQEPDPLPAKDEPELGGKKS